MWFPGLWGLVQALAWRNIYRGKPERGLMIMEHFSRRRPHDAMAWDRWAGMLFILDREDEALRVLDEALANNPDSPELQATRLGHYLPNRDADADTLPAIDVFLARQPQSPWPYLLKASAYCIAMDFPNAIRLTHEAESRLDKTDNPYMATLILAHTLAGIPSERDRAITLFEKAADFGSYLPIPRLYQAALLADRDPSASAKLVARARRHWHDQKTTADEEYERIRVLIQEGERLLRKERPDLL